jgi:hypothetical protein
MMKKNGSIHADTDGKEWLKYLKYLPPILASKHNQQRRQNEESDNVESQGAEESYPRKRQALSADESDIVEPSGALKQAQAVQNETYVDSPEASRALFLPEDNPRDDGDVNNNIVDVIQDRIRALQSTNTSVEGWRLLVADKDQYDAMTPYEIFRVQQKADFFHPSPAPCSRKNGSLDMASMLRGDRTSTKYVREEVGNPGKNCNELALFLCPWRQFVCQSQSYCCIRQEATSLLLRKQSWGS